MKEQEKKYGTLPQEEVYYPVSYTIKQDGTKVYGLKMLQGKDLTENQIIELDNIGWFSSPAPQEKEAVSDEEILGRYGYFPDHEADEGAMVGLKTVVELMSLVRQSERSLLEKELNHYKEQNNKNLDNATESLRDVIKLKKELAERSIKGEAEIPNCLEECRLTEGELKNCGDPVFGENVNYEIASDCQNKLLEKVALLIREAGMPTLQGYIKWWLWPENEHGFRNNEEIFDWFNEKFSLLLLKERETGKAFAETISELAVAYDERGKPNGMMKVLTTVQQVCELFLSSSKERGGE